MGDFIDAALGFPAVVFSVLLIVVVVYWVLVLAGALDLGDADADGGLDGILDRLDLGGTPASVVLSVVVAIGWFASLVGTVALDAAGVSTGARVTLAILVLLLALVIGGLVARLASRSAAPALPDRARGVAHGTSSAGSASSAPAASTPTSARPRCTPPDGSSAIVQVRQTGSDTFAAGMRALHLRLRLRRRVLLGRAGRPVGSTEGPLMDVITTGFVVLVVVLVLVVLGVPCCWSAGCSARSSRARR